MIDVSRRIAFSRVEIATSAKCSRFVPYRCMCRFASTANIWPGPMSPDGDVKSFSGDGGARVLRARLAARPVRHAEAAHRLLQRHEAHDGGGHARR